MINDGWSGIERHCNLSHKCKLRTNWSVVLFSVNNIREKIYPSILSLRLSICRSIGAFRRKQFHPWLLQKINQIRFTTRGTPSENIEYIILLICNRDHKRTSVAFRMNLQQTNNQITHKIQWQTTANEHILTQLLHLLFETHYYSHFPFATVPTSPVRVVFANVVCKWASINCMFYIRHCDPVEISQWVRCTSRGDPTETNIYNKWSWISKINLAYTYTFSNLIALGARAIISDGELANWAGSADETECARVASDVVRMCLCATLTGWLSCASNLIEGGKWLK